MIIEGITRGLHRARASVTFDNISVSSEVAATGGQVRSIELIGGRFATYEALYRTQPWVFATVNRVARGLSRLPLPIYIDGGLPGEREKVREGGLFDLIRQPWTTQSAPVIQPGNKVALVQSVIMYSLIHGFNVMLKDYATPDGRRSLTPTGLLPTSPFNWTPVIRNGRFENWNWRTARGVVPVFAEEVWVFAPFGIGPGGLPTSPMEALRTTLLQEDASQRAVIQRFEHGARPSGFISFSGPVENLRQVREEVDEEYGGIANFYKTLMLDNGATFQQMGGSFVESELISLRKLNREEVAAVINVPQPSVGILDRATFSNVTEQHLMEYMDTYGPPAVLFEESFQTQVIDPEPEWAGMYIEFNFREVLRGDPIREQDSLTKAAGRPILTLNEARAKVNQRPFTLDEDPTADTVLHPVNMSSPADAPAPESPQP